MLGRKNPTMLQPSTHWSVLNVIPPLTPKMSRAGTRNVRSEAIRSPW
jgi:hypothetical protein